MRSKKRVIANSLILFFFISPLSLLAQEKFLKLTNIIKYDSTIQYVANFNNISSQRIALTVPTGKLWKIQSINTMAYNGTQVINIDINNKLFFTNGTYDQTFRTIKDFSSTFGPLWCLPGDQISIYGFGTPWDNSAFNRFNYRLQIFEFILEQ
jgi:hypothetical protein